MDSHVNDVIKTFSEGTIAQLSSAAALNTVRLVKIYTSFSIFYLVLEE